METRNADRLDSLAGWVARQAGPRRLTRADLDVWRSTPTPTEPGFTRSRLLRLGVAGATSLLVAGYRPTRALAQSRQECQIQCGDRYAHAASRDIQACESLYRDPRSFYETAPDGRSWRRFRALIDRGGWGFINDVTNRALWEACERRAINKLEQGLDRCEDACKETCPEPGSRTPSAVTGFASVCHGTNPPRASKPTPPPAPSPANDPCAACVQVGGLCCGSCPNNPNAAPCLTRLTDGGTAGDCTQALSQC